MSKRPNVILCFCDQLRAFETGCYGHPTVRTPNIDRLARGGALFEVACSNSPLCVPARSVLMSGQYARTCTGTSANFCGFPPARERVVCPAPVLPEVLKRQGYRTGWIGKWHLHPGPDLLGFDETIYPHNLHQHHGQVFYDLAGNRTEVGGFSLDHEIEQVAGFLRRHKDQPFFLTYSLSPPHMPLMDAPMKYTQMYSRDQVVLRDNCWKDGTLVHDVDWFRAYLWDYTGNLLLHLKNRDLPMTDEYRARKQDGPMHGVPRLVRDVVALLDDSLAGPALREKLPFLDNDLPSRMDLRDLTALYYGMVTCVDHYVGQLMNLLAEHGLVEDTLVIFTSDHGDNLGSHHLWMKDRLTEESIRVPLIVHWPETITPSRIDAQVASLVDVAPTVYGLLGVEAPPTCQGTDLSDVVTGRAQTAGKNAAFIETYRGKSIGIRTRDHLYGIPMEGDAEENWSPAAEDEAAHLYYDLRTDPFQQANRAPAGPNDPVAPRLRRRLLDWHRTTPRLARQAAPVVAATQQSVAIY